MLRVQIAVPKLFKGEVCDCCADNYSMHARYLTNSTAFLLSNPPSSPGLPDWVMARTSMGEHIGYYSQCDAPTTHNLSWIQEWIKTNQVNYSANAVYVDTFARGFQGQPSTLLSLIDAGLFPNDTIVEGWNVSRQPHA